MRSIFDRDYPDNYIPEALQEETWEEIYKLRREMSKNDIEDVIHNLGAPSFRGEHLMYGEKEKLGKTSCSLEDWLKAKNLLKDMVRNLQAKSAAVNFLLAESRELSRSLQSCYPLPYNNEMFYLGWVYQAKFIRKIEHWSVAGISDNIEPKAKVAYEKCCELFGYMTEGLKTHNFSILHWEDGTEASFEFNVETVPGTIEIYFPLIDMSSGHTKSGVENTDEPMSMCLGWHFHDIIPVLDRFWSTVYSIDEIKRNLKKFVESEGWRDFLHKKFTKRLETGEEVELEKAPDWYEAEIQKSIGKSAMEKDWTKKEDKE